MDESFREGDQIVRGRYAWSLLSAGRRHETWLAWDEQLWSPVVVKTVDEAHRQFPPAYDALNREAAVLRRLAHPGIPRLLDHDPAKGFLVCEYIEGESLLALLDEGPMSPIDALLLGMQVGGILRALHQTGYVHLDVTPGNLLLAEGRAAVIDFGLTRHIGWRPTDGRVRGTRGYVGPERYDFAWTHPSMDVFGLGAVLHELVTGDSAYETATTEADLAERRPAFDLRGPRDVDERIPVPFDRLVRSCLDADPRQRPTMSALLAEMARMLPTGETPMWPMWAGSLLDGAPAVRRPSF